MVGLLAFALLGGVQVLENSAYNYRSNFEMSIVDTNCGYLDGNFIQVDSAVFIHGTIDFSENKWSIVAQTYAPSYEIIVWDKNEYQIFYSLFEYDDMNLIYESVAYNDNFYYSLYFDFYTYHNEFCVDTALEYTENNHTLHLHDLTIRTGDDFLDDDLNNHESFITNYDMYFMKDSIDNAINSYFYESGYKGYSYDDLIIYGNSKYADGVSAGSDNELSVYKFFQTIFHSPVDMFSGAFNWTMPLGDGHSFNIQPLMTFILTVGIALSVWSLIRKF